MTTNNKFKQWLLAASTVCAVLTGCTADQAATSASEQKKPRVIVTFDPELDDNNSLIRYMLYSSDFKTEGIVLTSSKFHWAGDGKGTTQFKEGSEYANLGLGPQTSWRWNHDDQFLDHVLEAYAQAYPNLKVHHPGYPTPEEIKAVTKIGNIEFEGDYSTDSPGSELIKQVLLDGNPEPVFVQTWGGASSVAAALRSIKEEFGQTPEWQKIYQEVTSKMVLCMSGDQDGTYPTYIAREWPDAQTQSLRGSTVPLSYMAFRSVKPEDKHYLSAEWMQQNIRSKAPFGEQYRVWGDGKQLVAGDRYDYFGEQGKTADQLEKEGYMLWLRDIQPVGSFLAEGDTFCYLNLIDNGLRAWQDQSWGGWSGRRREVEPVDTTLTLAQQYARMAAPDPAMPNFFPEVMDGLAARMTWCTTADYKAVNHYPIVNGMLDLEAAPGQQVELKAQASDPDGDELTLKWWQFKVGTYPGNVEVTNANQANTSFIVPADALPGQTIHLILEAADHGQPALKRYLRTVITVK